MEQTLFFVKPDCENPPINQTTALEVIAFLEGKLGVSGEFVRVIGTRTKPVPREFWLEFYDHIREGFPELYWPMCDEFAEKSIALFVYEGPDIAQRIKRIAGPPRYEDNVGTNTIREKFGNPEMSYRTVVHSSDRKDVKRELKIFKKYGFLKDLK